MNCIYSYNNLPGNKPHNKCNYLKVMKTNGK